MKTFVTIILVMAIVLFMGIGTSIMTVYGFSKNVSQHLSLADDASTASAKLKHLNDYRVAVETVIQRNDARYIFKQRQYTRDAQLEILATLITRLEDLESMEPKSFEYQTGMGQITGQEFNHVLGRINSIFWDCHRKETIWRWTWTLPTLLY